MSTTKKMKGITGNTDIGEARSDFIRVFDEFQKCDGSSILSVEIETTSIDVEIHQWNSRYITVKFKGEANLQSGDIEFETYIIDWRLFICLKTKGIITDSNLKFEVWIPSVILESLIVRTKSANVLIENGIFIRLLDVETVTGNIDINAVFVQAKLSSNSGNIISTITAYTRVDAKISTISGNIRLIPSNIRKLNLTTRCSPNGVCNRYKGKGGFVALIDVSSKKGKITVM